MRDHFRYLLGPLAALTLAALPGCSLDESGLLPPNQDPRGGVPRTSAIFCDIEDFTNQRHCASAQEQTNGIRLSSAAIALVQGRSSTIGLDDSPDARGRCNGAPEALIFKCPFPDGCPICLTCGGGVVGGWFASANDACVNFCVEKNVQWPGNINLVGTLFFCNNPDQATHARRGGQASTSANQCFANACSGAGALSPSFVDPRRTPEPVIWTNLVNVGVLQNSLSRNTATTTFFDAGASSAQLIKGGDAYMEFTTNAGNGERAVGLAVGATDTSPSVFDINFAFHLTASNQIYISENGGLTGPFGTAAPGDRLRVLVTDNLDGTASVSYTWATTAACAGMNEACVGSTLRDAPNKATYPLRVDASIRDQFAGFNDVRVVRNAN